MRSDYLEFEKPIAELEGRIEELKRLGQNDSVNINKEIDSLEKKAQKILEKTYANLTPWQKVQIARHPDRPQFLDYLEQCFEDFTELRGDRSFSDDQAIVGGIARFSDIPVMVIGQQKGRTTEERVKHNFGMPRPEGYRKSIRLMEIADKFKLPIFTFIDTAGAYPGIDAEARGQGQAIAASTQACLRVNVPIISIIIGEGFSGGAIAICTADRLIMLEHSIYTVISPEGCASILWKNAEKKQEAAEALKLTANDLKKLNLIDEIINEPMGGAHRDKGMIIEKVKTVLLKHLKQVSKINNIQETRINKYLEIDRKN